MRLVADLHIHSRYSMSTSKEMDLDNLCKWAQLKGIDLIGTGDFTHPEWFKEIKDRLVEEERGLFSLSNPPLNIPENCKKKVFFILTTEISCIYKRSDRTRRIHAIIIMPSLRSLERFNRSISNYGDISCDGRLTVKLDIKLVLDMILGIDTESLLIPSHVWTPHYSIFGSKYGFDSIEECFEGLTPYITTLETGLSSDISMNRQIKALDNINLVSFSDAHSPSKIGREATIFDTELSYTAIMNGLKTGQGQITTIEIFPQEGKYYLDGHRACEVSIPPDKPNTVKYKCPVCNKPLTTGVLSRIRSLSDRDISHVKVKEIHIVPLLEIISFNLGKGINTVSVFHKYYKMLDLFGSELYILLYCPIEKLHTFDSKIASTINQVRTGNVLITPGYDGKYGKVSFI